MYIIPSQFAGHVHTGWNRKQNVYSAWLQKILQITFTFASLHLAYLLCVYFYFDFIIVNATRADTRIIAYNNTAKRLGRERAPYRILLQKFSYFLWNHWGCHAFAFI